MLLRYRNVLRVRQIYQFIVWWHFLLRKRWNLPTMPSLKLTSRSTRSSRTSSKPSRPRWLRFSWTTPRNGTAVVTRQVALHWKSQMRVVRIRVVMTPNFSLCLISASVINIFIINVVCKPTTGRITSAHPWVDQPAANLLQTERSLSF